MDRKVVKRKEFLCCKVNNTFMEGVVYFTKSKHLCVCFSDKPFTHIIGVYSFYCDRRHLKR